MSSSCCVSAGASAAIKWAFTEACAEPLCGRSVVGLKAAVRGLGRVIVNASLHTSVGKPLRHEPESQKDEIQKVNSEVDRVGRAWHGSAPQPS